MEAVIEVIKNSKCNFCGNMYKDETKPFLLQVNFLRICKDCIDEIWKISEGIKN
jgi:hypothetical protein